MTETSNDILLISLGVLGLLLAANIGGEILRARLGNDDNHPTVEVYLTRVHSWWFMAGAAAFALATGPWAIILLFAFCSFAALREFLTLTEKTKADHWAMVAAFYIILPAQYLLVWFNQTGLATTLIPVYAFLFLPILSALRGAGSKFLERISETQWAMMICVFCVSHVPMLMLLDIPGYGSRALLLIAWLVLVVQLGDLIEYFAGRRIGKRKIARDISPKTLEGIGCGALFAMGMGALLWWITPFNPAQAAIIALPVFLVGVGGNLVLAAIKTDRGIRNWGHLIPGQGGFVDQLDSVFFAAPLFYHMVRFFWAA